MLKVFFPSAQKKWKACCHLVQVQKWTDGFNCGLFGLAFADILLNGKSPIDGRFIVSEMRNHFIKCLKEACLRPFPTVTIENR